MRWLGLVLCVVGLGCGGEPSFVCEPMPTGTFLVTIDYTTQPTGMTCSAGIDGSTTDALLMLTSVPAGYTGTVDFDSAACTSTYDLSMNALVGTMQQVDTDTYEDTFSYESRDTSGAVVCMSAGTITYTRVP